MITRRSLALAVVLLILVLGAGVLYAVRSQVPPTIASSSPSPAAATASSPAPSIAPTALPFPTKPTPCPVEADTTSVAVRGTVTWNGAPLAGVLVEAFQPGAPGRGAAQSTATTAADGSYQLTGLRSRIPWAIAVMEQPGFLPKTGAGIELCEKRDATVAPISALRTIAGLSLPRGATVAAGSQSLTWQPLAGSETYCVVITTPGDQTTFKKWTPDECPDTPPYPRGTFVTEPRYVSQALPAGGVYELGVYARAKGEVIGILPKQSVPFAVGPVGNVGICASTTLDPVQVENIPYWFFQVLDERSAAEIATCLADNVPDRDALARAFVASGGTAGLELKALPALADGSRVSMATPRWKEADAVGTWRSGETRWLVVRKQNDRRFAMEITTVAPR